MIILSIVFCNLVSIKFIIIIIIIIIFDLWVRVRLQESEVAVERGVVGTLMYDVKLALVDEG